MNRPNFFLVGAAKCGTTAMNDYLKQHPEIFVAPRKEIHFFGRDLTVTYGRPTEREYLRYFAEAGDAKRRGESSVWYLLSKCAADEIKAFSPEARILIMLRNPVDVLHSLHSEHIFRGYDDIEDFAAALDAEPDRKKGLRIPKTTGVVEAVFYREVIRYAEQVPRYFNAFGRENVHVILFDDFKSDVAAAYRHTLEFLGVDPGFAPDFVVVNPNKRARNKLLDRLIYKRTWGRSFRFKKWIPERLRAALRNFHTVHAQRAPIDPQLRRRLQEEFAPGVERLSDLLGRDLTGWSQAPPPAADEAPTGMEPG